MNRLFNLSISLGLFFLLGCTTTSNQVDFKKVKASDRVYFGNIQVALNGAPIEGCELYVGSDLVPSVKLSKDGYFVYRSSSEALRLSSVACPVRVDAYRRAWLVQSIPWDPISKPETSQDAAYIGHVSLQWAYETDEVLEKLPPIDYGKMHAALPRLKNVGSLKVVRESKLDNASGYLKENWQQLSALNIVDRSK